MTTVLSFDKQYNFSLQQIADDDRYDVWTYGKQSLADTPGVTGLQKARAWVDPDDVDTPESATTTQRRLRLIKQASLGADEHIVVSQSDPDVEGWEHITPPALKTYPGIDAQHTVQSEDADELDVEPPAIEEDVNLVEEDINISEGDTRNTGSIPDVQLKDVDQNELDGRWYLSVVMPEQVKPVVAWMADHGEADEYIGKVVLHHSHDYNRRQDCVHLFTVRNSAGDNHYGVVVIVPDRDEYQHFFEQTRPGEPKWRWSDVQVRAYGVPNAQVVNDLVDKFVEAAEWTNQNLGIWEQ